MVKSNGAIKLPIYDFLFIFNRNIGPNYVGSFTRCKASNQGDLDFDFSRSLKVKCDGGIGHPTYGFLLTINGNIGPKSAPLRDV